MSIIPVILAQLDLVQSVDAAPFYALYQSRLTPYDVRLTSSFQWLVPALEDTYCAYGAVYMMFVCTHILSMACSGCGGTLLCCS